ncbi:hypothetical protein Lal_00010801 [Lupinus albus]|nr:hypothetical protein Lal_00010801 [Lupinus albus]
MKIERMINVRDDLWVRELVSKYEDVSDWFVKGLGRRLRKRSDIRFWDDLWVGEKQLKFYFARLYQRRCMSSMEYHHERHTYKTKFAKKRRLDPNIPTTCTMCERKRRSQEESEIWLRKIIIPKPLYEGIQSKRSENMDSGGIFSHEREWARLSENPMTAL